MLARIHLLYIISGSATGHCDVMVKRKAIVSGFAERKRKRESHLYTDDNPQTTLHGTGFKNKQAAERTLELVQRRSLTYQCQTINTMLHRAKGHPHPTAAMQDAIEIFQNWMDNYKARRAKLPKHSLMSKAKVERYLKLAEERNEDREQPIDTAWAEKYVNLGKGKRLANTLMDDNRPDGDDLESYRQKRLDAMHLKTSAGTIEAQITDELLSMIMLGYCPVNL